MVRVKNWAQKHKRHKKFLRLAKGFRLGRSKVYKQVRSALNKQWQHSYKGRKEKKREFRKLWIERLSAAVRAKGMSYSKFIHALSENNVILDRKVLSNIAIAFPAVFDKIVDKVSK